MSRNQDHKQGTNRHSPLDGHLTLWVLCVCEGPGVPVNGTVPPACSRVRGNLNYWFQIIIPMPSLRIRCQVPRAKRFFGNLAIG